MDRRGFFRSLLGIALGPLAARLLPVLPVAAAAPQPLALSATLDELYATTWKLYRYEIVANIQSATPLYAWVRDRKG